MAVLWALGPVNTYIFDAETTPDALKYVPALFSRAPRLDNRMYGYQISYGA